LLALIPRIGAFSFTGRIFVVMLRSLSIKNYTIVDELSVTFDRGLSIITGETGAGKSVIIGALNLLAGERASADLVRSGTTKAVIEADFDISVLPEVTKWLKANEYEASASLIVRREISVQGSSRAFINDSPATLSTLEELGDLVIDLHGQHEHQSLLRAERHRDFLDAYASLGKELAEYEQYHDAYISLAKELDSLRLQKENWSKERDFLEFQRNEIKAVAPEPAEDEKIEQELNILENSEELLSLSGALHDSFYDNESSIYAQLSDARAKLEQLVKIDPSFEDALKELHSLTSSVKELASSFSRYTERIEFEPARLDELRNRAIALSRLKKKYGPALSDVIAKLDDLELHLGPEGNVDELLALKQKELDGVRKELSTVALKLHQKRLKAAEKFQKEIVRELAELGMGESKFEVKLAMDEAIERRPYLEIENKKVAALRWGVDKIEFFISTNKGEEPKPLAKVASGGEISRVMLAMKSVLSEADKIPVLIFDEIDTGISGRIAQKVGKAMKLLSKDHQIVAITHLGQIASFAGKHYVVEKAMTKTATTTSIRLLSEKEHIEEVARLLSGETLTAESLKAAKALNAEAKELAGA
jgi:DNA repair protein RecN (Recombination protein N)